jgi:beta-lactamase regulating signal transducer with metallopeptidase domain
MNWVMEVLQSMGVPNDVLGWVIVLVDVAVKSIVILGVAAAVTLGLRGASAALRHHVWAVALGGLLLLPLLSIVLPQWQVSLLPSLERGAQVRAPVPDIAPPAAIAVSAPRPDAVRPAPPVPAAPRRSVGTGWAEAAPEPVPPVTRERADAAGSATIAPALRLPDWADARAGLADWPVAVLAVWLAGASLVVSLLALGLLRVWGIARSAKPLADEELLALAEAIADNLKIRRPVRLLESQTSITPMTWGYRRPVVLLPQEAADWASVRRRDVLLHELAHVRRNDYVLQLIARYTCAVYWFNPFVWLAARQLRLERERACDDTVLNAGTKPSEYANHLLQIARSLKASQSTAFATVAMARPSQLTGRLLDVLDETRNRCGVSRSTSAMTWVVAAAVVLPLACAHAPQTAAAQPLEAPPEPRAAYAVEPMPDVRATEPEPEPEPLALESTGLGVALDRRGPQVFYIQDIECDVRRGDKHGTSSNSNDDRHTIQWWEGNCEGLIRIRGDVEFNSDFTDVDRLSRDGFFSIEIDDGETIWEVSITDGRGGLERRWFVDRDEQPYGAEAAEWFAAALEDFFRRSTYALDERVDWILDTRGVEGLLEEASLAYSSYLRARYYEKAIETGELDAAQVTMVFERAQDEIESDYELSRLLRSVPAHYLRDAELRRVYVATANGLESDYERSRVLRAILTQPGLEDDLVLSMLESATELESDYELSRLLREIADRYLGNPRLRTAYLAAASGIASDYERSRVLRAVFEQSDLTDETLLQLLESAVLIESDYELSRVLTNAADRYVLDAELRAVYFRGVNSIESDYERRKIISALMENQDLPQAAGSDILRSAATIGSDHELSSVLRSAAGRFVMDDTLRPLFFQAVEALSSDYERRRVLQAVTQRDDLSRAALLDAIDAIGGMSSDHDKSTLLRELGRRHRRDAEIVEALTRVADTLDSEYEYGRVMSVLRGRGTTP